MRTDYFASQDAPHRHILKYTLIYIVLSFVWIYSTDRIVQLWVGDPTLAWWISTAKGWIFVIVTAALLYAMMTRLAGHVSRVERSYHVLFDLASDSILVFDAEGHIIDVNERAENLLGYSRQELLQMKTHDIILPEEGSDAQSMIEQLKHSKSLLTEISCIRKDGTLLTLESSAQVLPDGRVLSIVRDVTERKRGEETLRESEARFTTVFRASPICTSITQLSDGMFLDVNDSFLNMFGYTRAEVIGNNALDLKLWVYPEDRSRVIRQLNEKGSASGIETVFRTKSGELRNVIVVAELIDIRGAPNILGLTHDITEQKRVQKELREGEAKRLNLERELIESQKLQSLGTLASGIAHDFNNILNIIMGHSHLITKRLLDPKKLAQSVDAIEKASQRGASLVRQLMTFARKTEIVFDSVQINNIVSEIAKMLSETFPKTIVITTNVENGLPSVAADSSQLHQVLMNLCVNARDAMPRGGKLSISTKLVGNNDFASSFPDPLGQTYVMVQVSDTGVGMDDDTKWRMFDPFFTTKDPGKGTGLGLSVVYSIIEGHRGMIGVDSTPGEGTTFRIYLPAENRETESVNPVNVELDGNLRGTETILLIEDEEMLSDFVETTLSSNGYTVLYARDGEEGLEIFTRRQREIAAVITDFGLPKISGKEVVEKIKAMAPNTKVILASGHIDPDIKVEISNAGAMCFLQKPYSPAEILLTVRKAIDTAD